MNLKRRKGKCGEKLSSDTSFHFFKPWIVALLADKTDREEGLFLQRRLKIKKLGENESGTTVLMEDRFAPNSRIMFVVASINETL